MVSPLVDRATEAKVPNTQKSVTGWGSPEPPTRTSTYAFFLLPPIPRQGFEGIFDASYKTGSVKRLFLARPRKKAMAKRGALLSTTKTLENSELTN